MGNSYFRMKTKAELFNEMMDEYLISRGLKTKGE
jgi:hypothetical protein